jgi:hypothetical protein
MSGPGPVLAPLPGSFEQAQLKKAAHALLSFLKNKKAGKQELLEDEDKTIWLMLTLKKIPIKVSDKPARMFVPV